MISTTLIISTLVVGFYRIIKGEWPQDTYRKNKELKKGIISIKRSQAERPPNEK